MKILLLFISLCFTGNLLAQELEILIKQAPPYMLNQDIDIDIYLVNTKLDTLAYFDSRGSSWDSFKEVWDLNVNNQYVEILPLNRAYDAKFTDAAILKLYPGDTTLIRTKLINLKSAGMYSFTYTHEQAPEFVKKELADRSVSDSLVNTISKFNVSKNIKFEVFKAYDSTISELITMSWEEWKDFRPVKLHSRKNHFDNLENALRHPQEVYSLTLFCDNLCGDDIKRISRLKNLRALHLHNCSLNYFPEELAGLNLYELTLKPKSETAVNFNLGLSQNNTLRELTAKFYAGIPIEVLSLKELVYLDVSDCPIKVFPALDSLQNLEVLIANNTQLTSLEFAGFNNLVKLKELNLSGNKEIDDLIPLLNCTNLEFLTINRTSIKKIPDEIENLKKLKKLSISSGLIAVTDSIGKLEDMRYLSFGGNRNLTKIPSSITNMKKLLHLDVSNTKIEQLPEGVSDLPLENVLIYNTNCSITKDYKVLKNRLGTKFKE